MHGARCDRGLFWEKRKFDEDRGECRRNAPVPTTAMIHRMADLLGEAAWALNSIGEIDSENEVGHYMFESTTDFYVDEWPMTRNDHWCGEFKDNTND